jgi:hypothetical protein
MGITSALVLMLSAAGPQGSTQTPSSPAQPDAAALERIRESVSKPPAVEVPREVRLLVPEKKKKAPTFRLTIEEEEPRPIWLEDPVVPLYVRTQRPAYHHEYLTLVTPEAFRASTLYPGMDVLSALDAFFDSLSDELRERREAEERRKVRKELERFNVFVQK